MDLNFYISLLSDDVLENNLANSLSLPQLEAPIIKREVLPSLTQGLKRHYREYFSDWFEPGSQISRGSQGNMRRRSSRKKKLHQKLVLSQVRLWSFSILIFETIHCKIARMGCVNLHSFTVI